MVKTICLEYYSNVLDGPLQQKVDEKLPGKLQATPLLEHGKVPPHTAWRMMDAIAAPWRELFPHPVCSPQLGPSDYHPFGELNKLLRGKRYSNLNAVKRNLRKCLQKIWSHSLGFFRNLMKIGTRMPQKTLYKHTKYCLTNWNYEGFTSEIPGTFLVPLVVQNDRSFLLVVGWSC